MDSSNQLSHGGAWLMGALFVACGVMPLLVAVGVIPRGSDDAPPWVIAAAGAVFICGGLAIVVDYGLADGMGPDGDLKEGTPLAVRVANFVLGLAIIGLMTAVAGWIGFGPGHREFTSTLTLPFLPMRWRSGELTGRIAFGGASVLMALMFVACGVSGVRRLRRGIISGQP